jgi:hypothetical protein
MIEIRLTNDRVKELLEELEYSCDIKEGSILHALKIFLTEKIKAETMMNKNKDNCEKIYEVFIVETGLEKISEVILAFLLDIFEIAEKRWKYIINSINRKD